jgi:hypothetical protein
MRSHNASGSKAAVKPVHVTAPQQIDSLIASVQGTLCYALLHFK